MRFKFRLPQVSDLTTALVVVSLLEVYIAIVAWDWAVLVTIAMSVISVALLCCLSWRVSRIQRIVAVFIFPAVLHFAFLLNFHILEWIAAEWTRSTFDDDGFGDAGPFYSLLFMYLAPAIQFILCIGLVFERPD